MTDVVATPIGFADSTLEAYSRDAANGLVVRVRAWNGATLVVHFQDVLGTKDVCAGDFSDLVRCQSGSDEFFIEVVQRTFETVPAPNPYFTYRFVDTDDQASLVIVATQCHVRVEVP